MNVVTISNQQYLVKKGDKIFIPKQDANIGDTLSLKSLMMVDGTKSSLDSTNPDMQAKVLGHVKGKKIVVFKKKRRKRYRRTKGHRQQFTQVEILN